MEIRSIKGVDKETWKKFKELSEKNDLKMSILLKIMVNKFEAESKNFWKEILNRKKNLTDKEAQEMLKVMNETRKEYGFRE